ncbi:hypothetical protein ALC57_05652, partial [Trachymyrmex cornetzi]
FVYARCGGHKEFIPELSRLFESLKLDNPDNLFLIARDLNARHTDWMNRGNNPRGTSLSIWLKKYSFKFRIHLLSTKFPSYPNGNSFLDIVLADAQLNFTNLTDDHYLNSLPYDSDHNAVSFSLSLNVEDVLLLAKDDSNIKFNYRKTNWNKFQKTLSEEYTTVIPNDRNLSITEIEEHIRTCDNAILKSIEKSVPRITDKDSVSPYINHKTKKLQKRKNKILTYIHRAHRKKLERRCLRSCLNLNRSAESDYTKYVPNATLYRTAKILRIDNFIIYLARSNFDQASKIFQNSLIFAAFYPNPLYFQHTLSSGYIPPEAFIFLDSSGLIQDQFNIPILYHAPRHSHIKSISYPPFTDSRNPSIRWKFDMAIPDSSILKNKIYSTNYWWLSNSRL